MLSFIEEHRPELARRHYIRKATAKNYWYDFSEGPLRRYRRKFGENFCLVIFGSVKVDDAYVIPYHLVKEFFTQEHMDSRRSRWIGTIRDGHLYIRDQFVLSVIPYRNRHDLLGAAEV
jgi:hypothetical protein